MLFNSTVWAPLWASVNILMFNIMTRYKEELSWTLCLSLWVWALNPPQTTFVLSDAVYSENIGSLELTFQFISALQNHTEDRFSIQIWLKYRHEKTLKKTFSQRRPGSYFQFIYFSLSHTVAWLTFQLILSLCQTILNELPRTEKIFSIQMELKHPK